jgi:hypothetical protein
MQFEVFVKGATSLADYPEEAPWKRLKRLQKELCTKTQHAANSNKDRTLGIADRYGGVYLSHA